MIWSISLMVAMLLSTLYCCLAGSVYCVTPTQVTNTSCSHCPRSSTHCATFSEYAREAESFFTSNTTMVFLPGDHILDINITVANIGRLSMCGESSSGYTARVVCNGEVGLSFKSMVDFKIHSLTFTSCGRRFGSPTLSKYTLLLKSIDYAELVNCSFNENLGTTIVVDSTNITLAEHNEFSHNHCNHEESCVGGGGITALDSNLTFMGGITLVRNHATFGSAGICMINCSLSSMGNIHFINNSLTALHPSDNSAVAIWTLESSLNIIGTSNFINNSNSAFSGAIYASNTSLSFTGTSNFINNLAAYGGAIYAVNKSTLRFTGTSDFISNSAGIGGGGGAIRIKNTSVIFNGTSNFTNNFSGAIHTEDHSMLIFTGTCSFINNSIDHGYGGAIAAQKNTYLSFNGTSNFINNSATGNGGGMYLGDSTLSILSNTTVYWENNHASFGGAIYVEDRHYHPFIYCTHIDKCTTNDECFFQLPGQNLSNEFGSKFVFKDNSANAAGSVLYGGAVDYCKLTGLGSYYSSSEVFNMLVHIEDDNTNSSISSDPFRICPCENNHPDCHESYVQFAVYPGETFHVSMVAVGQKDGTVPTTVRSRFTSFLNTNQHTGILNTFQYVQETINTCTVLNYTVFSLSDSLTLELYADGPCSTYGNKLSLLLNIHQTCPPGFNVSEVERSCVCNQRLAQYTNHCDISDGLGQITRNSDKQFWVGFDHCRGLILYPHCPLDYCVSHGVKFSLNHTDLQCAYNRSGLLCGACKKDYSLVLGTSQCKQCTNIHLALLIPFALMGLVLVFFLLVSKLTVATGTLSGLVFYANIVGANRTIFIPVESTDFLSVFVAWLNLDFGVETCFYNGMDTYSKTWLQFVFPIYIWVIVGLIILASHFSHRFTKLLGNNPVSVLATLVLLSYTKILRNLIAVIYVAYLEYPTHNRGVWLYDANIDYFSKKHIPLFVFVILVFFFLFVPYTFLLLFGQWLQAISHLRLFAWVNSARLKFFMDSYHAPYKARHRYWPGLLLVFRFILLLVFAFNPQQDPSINLLSILVGTAVLQLWSWTSGGVYKKRYLDALENLFALNLIILVGFTYHVKLSGGNQLAVGYTSATTAFVTFICILVFQLAYLTGITQCLCRKYTDLKSMITNRYASQAEAEVESESDTDSLPDRLLNPKEYEALSQTAPEHRAAKATESQDAVTEEPRRLITVYNYGSIN